jgi:hypothetical protein
LGVVVGFALAWSAVVLDVVAETAAGDGELVAFGRTLGDPGPEATLWIVAALVASATMLLTWTIASAAFRNRERRLAAGLDARFDRLAAEEAEFAARRDQLTGRLEQLHRHIESLARERQAIEDVLSRERRRAAELHAISIRTVTELDTVSRALEPETTQRGTIVQLPDAEPSSAEGASDAR